MKRKIIQYVGELEDDDLVLFVIEHLKDRKSPQKLVDELAQVRKLFNVLIDLSICRCRNTFFGQTLTGQNKSPLFPCMLGVFSHDD